MSDDDKIETNERGNDVKRGFDCMTDRYTFDFGTCSSEKGWTQYDTKQDASYFGIWVKMETREILTYCEGDMPLVSCPDDEHLKAELDDAERFYGDPPPMAIGIDKDGGVTKYYDTRPSVA